MRTPFDSIPHELLENIALFAVTSDPLGPPRELIPLLLVNRRLHAALSSTSNPHFHARIFAAKFDTAALVRRLGPGPATRAPKLAAELRRRCVQLGRLRAQVGCTVDTFAALAGGTCTGAGSGGGSGLTEEGMRALHEMLWTAYLMMLENDGKNERQLREYARLDRWLRNFWFAEDGASCAQIAIRDNAWPPNNDLSAVTMWLFWFLLRPGAYHYYLLFFFYFSPSVLLRPCRSNLNLPSLPPPFFSCFFCAVLPRVDGASSTYHVHAHTYTTTEEYVGQDDAEFRNVISILKLLALGAHQVCRACVSHLSLMMSLSVSVLFPYLSVYSILSHPSFTEITRFHRPGHTRGLPRSCCSRVSCPGRSHASF